MEYVSNSITTEWSLEAVIDRLKQNEQVVGLLLIGSLAMSELSPTSDYDLVIVLQNAPCPWYVGVTMINNRFTDLILVREEAIDCIQTLDQAVPLSHELAPVIRWLKDGVILYDRKEKLAHSQQHVQRRECLSSLSDAEAYKAWFALCYNLATVKRMISANDAFYRKTAGIRMAVYGHSDLWFGYFTMRKMVWDGDKAAVRYLQQNDPDFLETYQQLINTTSLEDKLLLYEQAAVIASVPFGGVWQRNITVTNETQSFQIWRELLGEKD